MGNNTSSLQPSDSATPPMPQLHAAYAALLQHHMPTVDDAKSTLQDPHATLWQEIVSHLRDADDKALQEFLHYIYSTSEEQFPTLPDGAKRRPTPKSVHRLRRKLNTVAKHAKERSACVDWVAVRIEAPVHQFDETKKSVCSALGADVAVVWRNDDIDAAVKEDLVLFGYAFREGGAVVMEVQILEPVASWVFEMNSKAKHGGQSGCVSFEESADFYEGLRKVILGGLGREALPNNGNVEDYLKAKRKGLDNSLDHDELERFQTMVDKVLQRQ